jgi:acetyltransferase-like isoleucine patch superfamily enzyme
VLDAQATLGFHTRSRTHDITRLGRERQITFPRCGRDVVIEEGVWVASHAMVLGPVRIGKHAVVAAGSLVLEDVAPYTVVAGRPAKVIKRSTRNEGRDRRG